MGLWIGGRCETLDKIDITPKKPSPLVMWINNVKIMWHKKTFTLWIPLLVEGARTPSTLATPSRKLKKLSERIKNQKKNPNSLFMLSYG
ncbi:hypothetical protein Sjap_021808 [Stephania japonica]|uniref:Uncharacterized protein n=1 Tax=Stephania japonica TaxID=461633 RepID=A0AAP0EN50_9MAGN